MSLRQDYRTQPKNLGTGKAPNVGNKDYPWLLLSPLVALAQALAAEAHLGAAAVAESFNRRCMG